MSVPAARLARFELRRFRTPLARVALVFVLVVPLLYGAVYLTANWDPYGRLGRLPVAVVNADTGAEVDGVAVTAGADFVANLHAKANFDYVDVTAEEAERGLREGDYYLAVRVPADFSSDLVSGQGDDPQRAQIMLERNDANGFVIGSITSSAQNAIARSVDESAVASYFDAVFANLATIRSGLVEARDGASQLADGIADARSGSAALADGAHTAADGAGTLADGAHSLADGLGTARSGSAALATGLDRLDTASGRLADGAAQVAAGNQALNKEVQPALKAAQQTLPRVADDADAVADRLGQVADRTDEVAGSLDTADDQLAALARQYPEIADSTAYQQARTALGAAASRSDEVADAATAGAARADEVSDAVQPGGTLSRRIGQARTSLQDLTDGSAEVAAGARRLHTGIGDAADGAQTLAGGVSAAATGASSVAAGADRLADGTTSLADGADRLTTGLQTARDGAGTLATRLGDGARRIPALSADERADAVQVLSSPADVTMQVDNPAVYYGRGLAPMFFSIALWVFGISVFLVVRPISGRALAGRASPLRLALTAWLPIGAIAVVAGWLMVGVVWAALGIDPVHPWATFGLVTLAAVGFSAIAHLLRTALGTPGSSLLLVLLILQLTAAGGTYPPELLPGFFAAVHPFLPMTYLVDAFRVVISGGQVSHLLRDVAVLLVVSVAALAAVVAVVRRRQQFRFADLHPPLVAP